MNTTNGQPQGNCDLWWPTCSDPDTCLDHENCFSCTKQLGCGWCDNRECLPGSYQGPLDSSCQQWNFGKNSSCAVNCTQFVDCYSCTIYSNGTTNPCGWCNSTSSCMEGTSQGPNSKKCDLWLWNTCKTSGERINCGIHKNCSLCVNDPSNRCGWCSTSKTCENVDNTNCPDFKNHKTCTDSCLDFSSNCSYCASNIKCGWCNGLCIEGIESGPSFRNCSNWQYHYCPPNDTCPLYQDCASCIASEKCGWCENGESSICMDASNKGQCQGEWMLLQCTAYVFTCSSLITCEECVNYPPGECVWCSREGDCRLAIEVGTSCDYSCGVQNFNMGPGVIAALIIVGVSVLGLAFGIWYRFYWVKRHYYEKLRKKKKKKSFVLISGKYIF